MTSVNPEQYFRDNDLKESLVIRMGYLREKMEFYLVIDFARTPELLSYLETGVRPSPSPPRDFRRLTFTGADNLSVSDVQVKRRVNLLDFSLKDNPHLTLQDLELQQNGKSKISLYFGTHGTCSFKFERLKVASKLGRGVKVNDSFIYYDLVSGQELDFYNPFDVV